MLVELINRVWLFFFTTWTNQIGFFSRQSNFFCMTAQVSWAWMVLLKVSGGEEKGTETVVPGTNCNTSCSQYAVSRIGLAYLKKSQNSITRRYLRPCLNLRWQIASMKSYLSPFLYPGQTLVINHITFPAKYRCGFRILSLNPTLIQTLNSSSACWWTLMLLKMSIWARPHQVTTCFVFSCNTAHLMSLCLPEITAQPKLT